MSKFGYRVKNGVRCSGLLLCIFHCRFFEMAQHFYPVILLLLMFPVVISSYKILVMPLGSGFNSRLLNIQKLADILAQDGHEVTVLMNSRIKEHTITKHAKTIEFYVPEEVGDINDLVLPESSALNFFSIFDKFMAIEYNFNKALMADTAVLKKIRRAKYDLIYGDNMSLFTNLLVSHLDITTILYENSHWSSESNIFFPITPSITCLLPGAACSAYQMDFKERVVNLIAYVVMDYIWRDRALSPLPQFAKEFNFTLHVPLRDVYKNKVTIVNLDYVLDMPIPTMPHIFPISGLYHKEPSPLTKEFADIVKSSEPHGVILLSFGTFMSEFDAAKADMFARVFGRLPQSVIWRFTGIIFKHIA